MYARLLALVQFDRARTVQCNHNRAHTDGQKKEREVKLKHIYFELLINCLRAIAFSNQMKHFRIFFFLFFFRTFIYICN